MAASSPSIYTASFRPFTLRSVFAMTPALLVRTLIRLAIACLALSWVVSGTDATARLIASKDFNYSPIGNDLNGNGGGGSIGFQNAWSGHTSVNIGNGSLKSPSDPLPASGNSATAVAFPENRGIDRILTETLGADDTSVYVSVLLQPQGTLGQGAYGGWFALVLRGSTHVGIGLNYSQGTYGLRIADAYSASNVQPVIGKPVFLVLRMDFTEGVDPAYVYINPQPGAPEPSTPNASLIDLGYNAFNMVSLAGPGGAAFDSIRIGTTYADVAPAVTDFNGDGAVNGGDLAAWQAGITLGGVASHEQGDADSDLDADGADMLVWQRQYGYQRPPTAYPVPEPSGMALAILCATSCGIAPKRRND